jgi:hypothetical protein
MSTHDRFRSDDFAPDLVAHLRLEVRQSSRLGRWMWALIDSRDGTSFESELEFEWERDARRAGLTRLAELTRSLPGAKMLAKTGEPQRVSRLVVVSRDRDALYAELQQLFADSKSVDVIRDRRRSDRRRLERRSMRNARRSMRLVERRKNDRRLRERHASVLKDVVYLIDDYAPDAKQREMEAVAQSLLRGQGNQAGRARLGRDLLDRPAFKPRGLIIATGEQHPSGASVLARTVLLELERGQVDLEALTIAQKRAAEGVYADAMTGYIEWLAPQAAELPAVLSQELVQWRHVFTQGAEHARIPKGLAHLALGLDRALQWAREIKAISDEQFGRIWSRSQAAFIKLGREQAGVVEEQRASHVFLRTVSVLLETGVVRLLSKTATDDVAGRGDIIGWHDQDAAYLLFAAAYRAAASRRTTS